MSDYTDALAKWDINNGYDRVVVARAIAHIERGIHLLKVLSQSYDTIEDTDAGEE